MVGNCFWQGIAGTETLFFLCDALNFPLESFFEVRNVQTQFFQTSAQPDRFVDCKYTPKYCINEDMKSMIHQAETGQ